MLYSNDFKKKAKVSKMALLTLAFSEWIYLKSSGEH